MVVPCAARLAIIDIDHEPGSLAEVLNVFARAGAPAEVLSCIVISKTMAQVSISTTAESDDWRLLDTNLRKLPTVQALKILGESTPEGCL